MSVIDTSGLIRLFLNKDLGMMVGRGETLGTQGKVKDLRNIRRREKGIGKLSDGSRTTNPIDITALLSLALVLTQTVSFIGS